MKSCLRSHSLTRLSACLSAVVGIAAETSAWASTTHVVNSCDDSATAATTQGTLRYEILNAAPTDSIDVTGIETACGTSYLTLYSGEIPIKQSALAIFGSGKDAIRTVNGRIFAHTGSGTLSISDLTIESGYY